MIKASKVAFLCVAFMVCGIFCGLLVGSIEALRFSERVKAERATDFFDDLREDRLRVLNGSDRVIGVAIIEISDACNATSGLCYVLGPNSGLDIPMENSK